MLTAMTAVDNIIAGDKDKESLWSINTEMEYHEERADKGAPEASPQTESRDKHGVAV